MKRTDGTTEGLIAGALVFAAIAIPVAGIPWQPEPPAVVEVDPALADCEAERDRLRRELIGATANLDLMRRVADGAVSAMARRESDIAAARAEVVALRAELTGCRDAQVAQWTPRWYRFVTTYPATDNWPAYERVEIMQTNPHSRIERVTDLTAPDATGCFVVMNGMRGHEFSGVSADAMVAMIGGPVVEIPSGGEGAVP